MTQVNGYSYIRCFFVIQILLQKHASLWQREQMPKIYVNLEVDFLC